MGASNPPRKKKKKKQEEINIILGETEAGVQGNVIETGGTQAQSYQSGIRERQ